MTTRRALLALPVALAGWLAVLALVMRLGGAAPAALVVLPPAGFAGRLPAAVAVADANAWGLTLRATGGAPGLVAAFYAAGAPLVLPAGLAGCLGLRR